MKTCSIDDCDSPVRARGWCSKHYGRFTRHGDPTIKHLNRGKRGSPNSVAIGDRFGRWTISGPYERGDKNRNAYFPCICDCGNSGVVPFRTLREAEKGVVTGSCGCAHREAMAARRKYVDAPCKSAKWRKEMWLRRAYGIDMQIWDQMLIAQSGLCSICGDQFENKGHKRPFVDHSHVSGIVRGLLCQNCNTGIGHFHDDEVLMRRAIEYLDAAA
jgi:hypothetical protein